MMLPSHADALEVLCLQAAADGRGEILFGNCLERVRGAVRPFVVGERFPGVYLEFPLTGEPFLDITVLISRLRPGTRITSPIATDTDRLLDWFAKACTEIEGVCFGFELDTKDPRLPEAAVHFQHFSHTELVEPFFDAIGEPERARLFLEQARRMPAGWALAFFGLFRGRPASPLRVCGYLDEQERRACAADPACLVHAFDTIGFMAYDGTLLERACALLAAAPGTVDFQFDVLDDGRLGTTFAFDVQFGIARPEEVRTTFASGSAAHVMALLEDWGVADDRWRPAIDATFARSVDVELGGGDTGRLAFTLMPQWVKARWTDCEQQPSKLYHLAKAMLVT